MTRHYKLSPSATSRWLNCPGSLALSEGQPRKESVYALEGTAAHAVAEECLKSNRVACLVSEDQDTAYSVQLYLDDIQSFRERYKVIAEHTERTLRHSDIPNFGGTQDHLIIYETPDGLVCHVFDYKHGQGKIVDAEENLQALSYFAIVQSHYEFIDFHKFAITIVQPRTFAEEKIKYWECGPERVQQHVADIIRVMENPNVFKAGDWCNWCPALQVCETVKAEALRIAQLEFSDIQNDVDTLVELQRIGPAVEALLAKVPMALLEAYRREPIPGFKVIQTSTHRRWKSSDTVGEDLAKLGLSENSIYEPRKVRTPAKIESEVDDVDLLKTVSELWEKPPGGYKVVLSSARGKAVDLNDVSEFEVI